MKLYQPEYFEDSMTWEVEYAMPGVLGSDYDITQGVYGASSVGMYIWEGGPYTTGGTVITPGTVRA